MDLPQYEIYCDLGIDLASSAPYALPVFGRDPALVVEDFEPARPEFAEVGHESLQIVFVSHSGRLARMIDSIAEKQGSRSSQLTNHVWH